MKNLKRLGAAAIATAALLALAAGPASAAGAGRPLFVQTDNTTGNQVVVYDRAADGTLTQAGIYPTGGLGGKLEGSVVDHTASQGALALDSQDGLLFAVNAGSNTVSVFGVFRDRLALRQTISSGGTFPVSVAVQNGLVYVLNAEEGASLQGFRVIGGRLVPISESSRALGLDPTATPQFVNTPGQVVFSPDGSQLLVTTKANGSAVDVFGVDPLGRLSATPTVNSLPGAVPFAIAFDRLGHAIVTEAGPSNLADFQLGSNGELAQLDQVATGQAATCWVVRAAGRFYASNAGSASLSDFQESAKGNLLTEFGQTTTDAGTVDAAVPTGDRFLYVQAGGEGKVDEYSIGAGGALAPIGSVTVPGAVGGEGIVAP
jgi:6-phosphogluconolactonase (cycloisomerase 2 family)